MMLAIGLVWSSSKDPGIAITIHFDQGHGLKVGDSLRHRGIEIGHVTAITLDDDLAGIVASVSVDRSASAVVMEGSRFWIVRPQVDVSGVSGLETAIGSKYLRVIPGDSGLRQTEFQGLGHQPADDEGSDGIEVVLRGEDRYGIHAGAPVTWRGIEVGRVLSASLSPDALEVDLRIRVDEGYRRLVTVGSKFWVTSGINIDVGVTGVEVNAESLATIARGGIGMISTGVDANDEVRPGSVFRLYRERDDDWIDSAVGINLLQSTAPATLSILASWKESFLGISRARQAASLGIVIAGSDTGKALAVFPADMVVAGDSMVPDSFSVGYQTPDQFFPISSPPPATGPIVSIEYPYELPGGRVVPRERIRTADVPEDCFLVRGDGGKVTMQMIGRQSIAANDRESLQGWDVAIGGLSRLLWHGAPVISAVDERVIGMLIVGKAGAKIVPIPVQ
jgi:hypothetical protein